MAESLNKKTAKGISWSLVETVSFYFIKFLIGIVLARLLSPEDFGVLAIMMVFISISDVFIDFGFGQAYIHKENVTNKDANTVFVLNLLISLAVYLILYFTAPLIADFYNIDSLTLLIRVLSLGVIITSFNVIQNAIVRREFQFRKRAIVNVVAAIISGIVGIICAYNGLGVWSLVIQQLLQKILCGLLLYFLLEWHLTLSCSKDIAKEMFSYGGWILLANVTLSAFNNFYRFAFGKLFNARELGFYERGKQFESLIAETFTSVVGKVAFPTYSRIQSDSVELEKMTCRFVKYSSMFIMPMLAVLCVVSKPMILFLLSEKWLPAVPYLQLLCVVGILYPIFFFINPLLQAVGQTKRVFNFTIMLSLFRVLNVLLLYKLGISAIIIGEFICILMYIFITSFVVRKQIGFSYLVVFKSIWKIILYILFISVVGFVVLNALPQSLNVLLQIIIPSVSLLFIYICFVLYFEREDLNGLIKMIKNKK